MTDVLLGGPPLFVGLSNPILHFVSSNTPAMRNNQWKDQAYFKNYQFWLLELCDGGGVRLDGTG
jgi:hypothetical protein